MLVINVWHFFFRKWCLPQCFTNLFKTFDSKHNATLGIKTQAQVKDTTEILIIGYMSGISLMPGANMQFQYWFICLVPLLIEMVGLPQILTFWIYANRYPIVEGADPKYQHIMLLSICAWLNTVGPKKCLGSAVLDLLSDGSPKSDKKVKD